MKRIKLGETKDADVLLVHSPAAEKKFIADGFATERNDVMYNDFVIVGPTADPAGVKGSASAAEAMGKIAEGRQGGQGDVRLPRRRVGHAREGEDAVGRRQHHHPDASC